MILGLTGGIGCGKSTAARFVEEAGFRRIDSDRIVREELLTRADVAARIGERYPEAIDTHGGVKRAALAARVFADDAELEWLESQVHPLLYERWRNALQSEPGADWIVEVPLLFEKRLENWFDFIGCVTTTSMNQFARLTERGLPRALAEQRISKQLPLVQKIERADYVLSNDGSLNALQRQVAQLVAAINGRR